MKAYNTKEDEVLRIQSLMGIANINKSKVIQMANSLLNAIPRRGYEWKIKTKIVLYTEMIITGAEHHKQVGVERLKEVLEENEETPKYRDYYLNISERLKVAAHSSNV